MKKEVKKKDNSIYGNINNIFSTKVILEGDKGITSKELLQFGIFSIHFRFL